MHMPLRDAFYCFVQICHKYLPGYYSAGLASFLKIFGVLSERVSVINIRNLRVVGSLVSLEITLRNGVADILMEAQYSPFRLA